MPGPNWISQAELDDIRAQQIDLIAEIGGLGDIKRPITAADNNGGSTLTYTTQSNVPMRIWISSGTNGTSEETRFWAEQELFQTDAFAILAHNADLQIYDYITFDSRQWKVVGLSTTDTFKTAIRARLKAMRP